MSDRFAMRVALLFAFTLSACVPVGDKPPTPSGGHEVTSQATLPEPKPGATSSVNGRPNETEALGKTPATASVALLRREDASSNRVRSLGYLGGLAPGAPNALGSARASMMQPGQMAAAPAPYDFDTEQYASIEEPGFVAAVERPLSTFSIDVDTASYSNVRRFLSDGSLPPSGAVRIEEMINYFSYEYPAPGSEQPFSVTTEIAKAPWAPEHQLVLVGLQGRRIEEQAVPPRNLVFLVDVSGSMTPSNKLPLVIDALTALTERLRSQDNVAIVVYAGASGCVLAPTSGDRKQDIRAALARLEAGGSTNGAQGIQLAYALAREHFQREGINRVILATDGDFNVGVTSESELVDLIEEERKSGVFLTVLGAGMGNLKDATMEQLADHGNGNYAYLDSPAEARKVLVEQAGGTLVTIAKDVKIQVEFNPARVKEYRLIGYENRRLNDEDFNDDAKDAGEIGAGHSVTALYEVVPVGAPSAAKSVDPLRYQQPRESTAAAGSGELLTVKLRYKEPDGATSKLTSASVSGDALEIAAASRNLRFAAAVAAFGMSLRGSEQRGSASFEMAQSLARDAVGADPNAYRSEFVRLVAIARDLSSKTASAED
jgi:Ca-activated chloride channel family protein